MFSFKQIVANTEPNAMFYFRTQKKKNIIIFLKIFTLHFYVIIIMYSFSNALLLQSLIFFLFSAIMSLQTVHVLLGEELNTPSFCSGPYVNLRVILCML